MPGEFKEEYLETIYELSGKGRPAKTNDIAERMNVAPASVTEMLGKLADDGFVDYKPYYGTTLTKKGFDVAKKLKWKHRLLERFLYDVLGIQKGRVHEEACRLEHGLSDEAADALDEMLEYPAECPDDKKPIPPLAGGRLNEDEILLSELKAGGSGRIVRMEGGKGMRENLRCMGVREGKTLSVVAREPAGGPVVVKTGNTTVSIGRGMASRIIVEVKK
jgi:DtxR family Mn-dependent transcriptional regulator